MRCGKAVHAIDSCSKPTEGSKDVEEGYGQKRICTRCNAECKDSLKRKDISNSFKTSIVDRPDLTTNLGGIEGNSVEGWKGLLLPPKKRTPAFYWRPNPDFPMLVECNKRSRLEF